MVLGVSLQAIVLFPGNAHILVLADNPVLFQPNVVVVMCAGVWKRARVCVRVCVAIYKYYSGILFIQSRSLTVVCLGSTTV